jgi:uncharacterized protein
MIARLLFSEIQDKILNSKKIVLLFGPRQVGKTTLIKSILADFSGKKLEINADQTKFIEIFSSRDLKKMQTLVAGFDLLFIDEAQRIPEIGINLKILHDEMPQLKIVATGSSSFELANRTREALTGRTATFSLFPIAVLELSVQINRFELAERMSEFLIFGNYPEVLNLVGETEKIRHLSEMATAYLYKDLLEMTNIKHPDKLFKLLRLLALQIGNEVSLTELGNALQISKDTIATYIDLLEKSYVIFRLSGFSRNLKKEIVKMDKIYFYDLGIRNALIDNFNALDKRSDQGGLWENFLVVERKKSNSYLHKPHKSYFWRTYTGAKIDYVEEGMGILSGFEFKFSQKTAKSPKSWAENYPEANFLVVNKDNFLDFLL